MFSRKNQSAPIKRGLECPICFEDYSYTTKIPKSLVCGHTVCADCIKNIFSDNHFRCPVCRKDHASPGRIDDLPTNFAVLSIVDSMCQDCRNALKTDRCQSGHCNQQLCDPCRERHLQVFQSDYQQTFIALQAEITQLEASCSDSHGLNTMIDQQNKVIKQVNNTCDGLKDQIEKIRKNTIQEIKASVIGSTNSFLQWQESFRKSLEEGKKIIEQSKKLSSMNEDLYNKCETLRKELVEKSQQMPSVIGCSLNASLSDITTVLPDHLDVSYSTVTTLLPDHLDVSYSAVTQTPLSDHLDVSYSAATQDVGSLNREHSPVKPEISREDYRSYTGRVVYQASKQFDISVSQSTGLIAFTGGGVLHIISDQFEALSSWRSEKMSWSSGTVIGRDNKIFVSDSISHNISMTHFKGRNLNQTIGSEGQGHGQFWCPKGLAMDEDDTLFVCDSGNHRICCFTTDRYTRFFRQFGSQGDRRGQFRSEPDFIAASRLHDKVAVSDHLGNLYIFSHGGDHYRTITARKAPYNMEARGVAIDAAGRIIVADIHGNQLLVLNDNLLIAARMGSEGGGPGQLRKPCGVALTARGEVLVCDWNNKRIQMFSNNQH